MAVPAGLLLWLCKRHGSHTLHRSSHGQVGGWLLRLASFPAGNCFLAAGKFNACILCCHSCCTVLIVWTVLCHCQGGSSRTMLIICCSPCWENGPETLSSLRWVHA